MKNNILILIMAGCIVPSITLLAPIELDKKTVIYYQDVAPRTQQSSQSIAPVTLAPTQTEPTRNTDDVCARGKKCAGCLWYCFYTLPLSCYVSCGDSFNEACVNFRATYE